MAKKLKRGADFTAWAWWESFPCDFDQRRIAPMEERPSHRPTASGEWVKVKVKFVEVSDE